MINRRLLLVQMFAVIGALLSGKAAVARGDRSLQGAGFTASRLVSALRSKASAAAVGRAYLETVSDEATVERLSALIAGELQDGALASIGDDGLRERLAAVRRRDFEREHVVVVRGWVLSRTEARLCALSCLM